MISGREGNLFIRNLPTHIKDHFKAYCAKRGMNMTQVIVDFMRACVEDDKNHLLGSERTKNNELDSLRARRIRKEVAESSRRAGSQH